VNLELLRSEFLTRGFDYLTEGEANNYLNDAYLLDICEEEDWPFLEATAEGTAPLTIADLRTIEYVTNTTRNEKLDPILRARITDDWNPDLTQTGTPELYYVTEGSKVNIFPVSTSDTIAVRYWKVAPRLVGAATPLLPERFHSLIIDGAVARAYRKTADWELRNVAKADFEAELERMQTSLGMLHHDAPDDYIVITDPAALH
jgi:hypothetical protein